MTNPCVPISRGSALSVGACVTAACAESVTGAVPPVPSPAWPNTTATAASRSTWRGMYDVLNFNINLNGLPAIIMFSEFLLTVL